MTAAAQRTPVSLLLEMCNQNSWEPEYELTSVIGASHDPTFTYKVTVGDVSATASGQSKRKAKHSAAKFALIQLLSNASFVFEGVTVTAENIDNVMVEPVLEPVPVGKDSKNAVGVLQEHCVKNKLTPPYYETTNEIGPPHDKTFSVRCMVEHFTTFGEGKTKKIAKRVAAEIMLQKLVDDGISFKEESEQKGGNKENISSSSESSDCNLMMCSDLLKEINISTENETSSTSKLMSDEEEDTLIQVINDKGNENSISQLINENNCINDKESDNTT